MLQYLIPSALQAVGGIVQGNINRDAQTRATEAARQSAERIAELYKPYQAVGGQALSKMQGYLTGSEPVTESPEYAWQSQLLKQRLAGIGQNVGGTANAAYFSPLIASEFANRMNRLLPAINMGQYATSGIANAYNMTGRAQQEQALNVPQYGNILGQAVGTYQQNEELDKLNRMRDAITQMYLSNPGQFPRGTEAPIGAGFYDKYTPRKELSGESSGFEDILAQYGIGR